MYQSSAPIETRMKSIASARMRCDVSPRRSSGERLPLRATVPASGADARQGTAQQAP